jgi:predicted CXXCH cytochrome family protein
MHVRIRHVTRAAGGGLERRDIDTTRDVISIGRATDQTIYLADRRVALNHATITAQGDGRFRIESLAVGGVSVNGTLKRAATLDVGDRISIGGYELTIVGAPTGWDLVLTVEQVDVVQIPAGKEHAGLSGTGWSRRRLSWILFTLTLLFTLAAPLLQPSDSGRAGATRNGLPSTTSWSPGPLFPAHSLLAKDCEACHREPFTPVADAACLACHAKVPAHVAPGHPTTRELSDANCTDCHREHKEPRQLVDAGQRICADCHAALSTHPGIATELRDAADFGEAHPGFAFTQLVPDGHGAATTWSTVRDAGGGAPAPERSNLEFTHAAHLAPGGIKGADGRLKVMVCEDCHRADPSGRYMLPVRMETDCRSCHGLVFDAAAPEREVPHGSPSLVQMSLEEYYSRQFLNEAMDSAANVVVERDVRRPGRAVELSPAQRAQAADRAHQRAASVASELFERRACATCHAIVSKRDADGSTRYDVEPVRLNTRWLPKVGFSHLTHRDAECSLCHRAAASDSAADVLMPQIEDCRECHSGDRGLGRSGQRIASGCMMCHGFHVSTAGTMADQ